MESGKIEADNGKQAMEIAQRPESQWYESSDTSTSVAIYYQKVHLVNKDGDSSPDEVYQLNVATLVDMDEPRESFCLMHPKGWRHS